MNYNKKAFLKSMLGTAVLVALSSQTVAGTDFNANLELDTDATDTAAADTAYDQNGRVELNVLSRREKGEYFVQAKGTVLLTVDGSTAVDDAYVQFGSKVWDIQAGRFEAVNLFPKAKDTLIVHAGGVSVYEANMVRGRIGDGGGQFALHYNASDNVKFEVATIFGDENASGDDTTAVSGVRPAITWSTDGFSLFAGYEKVKYDLSAGGTQDKSGFGIGTNFDLGAANINIAAARSKDENTDEKVTSYIANMVYGNFGAGVIRSDVDQGSSADPKVTTAYLAYTVPLLDIEGASVTFAGSFSSADNVIDDEATALRMRLNYTF